MTCVRNNVCVTLKVSMMWLIKELGMIDKEKFYGDGPFVHHLCESLKIGPTPKLIRYYTNLIYDCGDFVIRLTPNSFRPRKDVIRELHWLSYVASQTQDVVQVLDDDPTRLKQFEFESEEFTVTFLKKIDGCEIGAEQWNAGHFTRLGKLAGFMHRVGMSYRAPPGWELLDWDDAPESDFVKHIPNEDSHLVKLNQDVLKHIVDVPRYEDSFGPIHFDIHQGNYLLTKNDRLVLLDFENSCLGHHINDIAMVLFYAKINKITDQSESFVEQFLEVFWRGYEGEYTVPESEIKEIPWFMMCRAIGLFGYLHHIFPADRNEEQNQYVERVRRMILEIMPRLT